MEGPLVGLLAGRLSGPLDGPLDGPVGRPLAGPLDGPLAGAVKDHLTSTGPVLGQLVMPNGLKLAFLFADSLSNGLAVEQGKYYLFAGAVYTSLIVELPAASYKSAV